MRVVYIKDSRSKGYIRIGIDDGERLDLTVSESVYTAAGSPMTRDFLSEEAVDLLRSADAEYRARSKALSILSYGDNSPRMLSLKLSRAGFSKELIESTVGEMISLGYINTSRQLDRLIQNEVQIRLTGPRKLVPKLISKGYSRADINDAIERLSDEGKIDFERSRRLLIEKNCGKDDGEIKKILFKNGYSVC